MVPLVSLIWTVVSKGITRLDGTFFSNSMVGVVGEGGGAYHAIMGTLIITALAALISVPIGLLAAVYLVEYGRGTLKRTLTFFVDVMTGIPRSWPACSPTRCSRSSSAPASGSASAARSRCRC